VPQESLNRYGVASEHTTLLLLHEAVQFVDNALECPPAHPAHAEWRLLVKAKAGEAAAEAAAAEAAAARKLCEQIAPYVDKFKQMAAFIPDPRSKKEVKVPNMTGPGPNMGGPPMQGGPGMMPMMGGPNMGGPPMGGPPMQGGPNMGRPMMGGPNMSGPGPMASGPPMGGRATAGQEGEHDP
jgi:hypothetical protein